MRGYSSSVDPRLDRDRLEDIIQALGDRLDGDWLLVGGALVALWVEPRRVTADDLVGLGGTMAERLALMEAAEGLGLPVEALNSAADFFVRRVAGWREQIEPFRRGRRATIHRPTPTLFLLLKLARLSEQDLADCLAVLDHAGAQHLTVDGERVLAALDALPDPDSPAHAARRQRLRNRLRR